MGPGIGREHRGDPRGAVPDRDSLRRGREPGDRTTRRAAWVLADSDRGRDPIRRGQRRRVPGTGAGAVRNGRSGAGAGRARLRARPALGRGGSPAAGRGLYQGTLATTRAKRGDHRAFIAIRDAEGVATRSVLLVKDLRDRAGEEAVVSALLIEALAEACGAKVSDRGLSGPAGLLEGDRISVEQHDLRSPLALLLAGERPAVLVTPDGQLQVEFERPAALLPG